MANILQTNEQTPSVNTKSISESNTQGDSLKTATGESRSSTTLSLSKEKSSSSESSSNITPFLFFIPFLIAIVSWVYLRSKKLERIRLERERNPVRDSERVTSRSADEMKTSTTSSLTEGEMANSRKTDSLAASERSQRDAAAERARQLAIKERKRQKRLAKQNSQNNSNTIQSSRLATRENSRPTPANVGSDLNTPKQNAAVDDTTTHIPIFVKTVSTPPIDADEAPVQPRSNASPLSTVAINATRMKSKSESLKKHSVRRDSEMSRLPEKVVPAGFMKYERAIEQRRVIESTPDDHVENIPQTFELEKQIHVPFQPIASQKIAHATNEPRTLKDFLRNQSESPK